MPTQNKQQNAETPRKLNLANAKVVLRPDPLLPQNHYQRKILNPQIFRFGRAMKKEKGCLGWLLQYFSQPWAGYKGKVGVSIN